MAISNVATSLRSSWNRFQSYRTFRSSVRELDSLDDRQLADIGLERSRIPEVARSLLG